MLLESGTSPASWNEFPRSDGYFWKRWGTILFCEIRILLSSWIKDWKVTKPNFGKLTCRPAYFNQMSVYVGDFINFPLWHFLSHSKLKSRWCSDCVIKICKEMMCANSLGTELEHYWHFSSRMLLAAFTGSWQWEKLPRLCFCSPPGEAYKYWGDSILWFRIILNSLSISQNGELHLGHIT